MYIYIYTYVVNQCSNIEKPSIPKFCTCCISNDIGKDQLQLCGRIDHFGWHAAVLIGKTYCN